MVLITIPQVLKKLRLYLIPKNNRERKKMLEEMILLYLVHHRKCIYIKKYD